MDPGEFRRIFDRHAADAYRIALAILDSPEEAEEAVQDAFMKVYHAHDRFRGDAKLATWISRIVINTCLTRVRRPDRVREHQVQLEIGDRELDESMENWELSSAETGADLIRKAIARLPPREAAAIVLFYFQDRDYKQIASTMSIATGTVGVLLRNGRQHLHVLLSEKGKEKPR